MMDRAAANLMLPAREADWRAFGDDVKVSSRSILESIKPIEWFVFPSSYWALQQIEERHLGRRDGLLPGIALEVYRRQRGTYPDSLDALVPQFLPKVPADRITGEPIRYRIVDGRPLIYSVGADRKDDGGRPTADPRAAATWEANPDPLPDGDWVLYPN